MRVEVLDERHRGQMARDDFPECDVNQVAVLIDHRVERIEFADRAHDLELFLVQRIADEVALDGERVLHEAGGMEGANGRVAGDAGCDHLAAAGPAGHEMRLDQAGGDAQIGIDKNPVDADRGAAGGGRAQINMVVGVARVVIQHAHVRHHPRIADDLGQFVAQIRAMQAGRDQDRDLIERNAAARHCLDHGTQEQPVRHRPGDVTDENAGATASAREVAEGPSRDRMIEGVADGRGIVGQLRQDRLPDEGRFGSRRQHQRQRAATIGQLETHP